MIDYTQPCYNCDGDGEVPSDSYKTWHNVGEQYLEEWNKSHPIHMCPICNGNGRVIYIDGEEEMFSKLVEKWTRDTMNLSSIDHMRKHPCYQVLKKIGRSKKGGKKVVSFILKRISHETSHIMTLLTELIGRSHNPIPDEMRGSMMEVSMTWVKWGIQKGFIDQKYEVIRKETEEREEREHTNGLEDI